MIKEQFDLKMFGLDKIFQGNIKEHILDSMNASGISKTPNGCHGGGCGVCKIKISKGVYKTLSMSSKYISKEEELNGFVLACRVFPESNIEFEFIGKPKCKVNEKKKYGFV